MVNLGITSLSKLTLRPAQQSVFLAIVCVPISGAGIGAVFYALGYMFMKVWVWGISG